MSEGVKINMAIRVFSAYSADPDQSPSIYELKTPFRIKRHNFIATKKVLNG